MCSPPHTYETLPKIFRPVYLREIAREDMVWFGMVVNALAANGIAQSLTRRMEETVLGMPELVVSGDGMRIHIIDGTLRTDHAVELVSTGRDGRVVLPTPLDPNPKKATTRSIPGQPRLKRNGEGNDTGYKESPVERPDRPGCHYRAMLEERALTSIARLLEVKRVPWHITVTNRNPLIEIAVLPFSSQVSDVENPEYYCRNYAKNCNSDGRLCERIPVGCGRNW